MAIVTSIASTCPVRPPQVQVVHHGFATVVVEVHLHFGQAQLHELLGDSIVATLRFSAGHSVRIMGVPDPQVQRLRQVLL